MSKFINITDKISQKFLKNELINKADFDFEIKLMPIFLICIFWTFFLNFGLNQNLLGVLFSLVLITFTTLCFFKYENKLDIKLNVKDLLSTLLIVSIFWIATVGFRFSASLDQLYHLLTTYQIPVAILKILGPDLIANSTQISAKSFFQIYSLIIISSIVLFYFLYIKHKKLCLTILIVISAACLVAKIFFNDPQITHPELRTLPLSLLGAFGIENNIFKLQGALAISLLIIYLKNIFDLKEFTISSILILSCPLIYFTAPLIEFSIWALVVNSILLIHVTRSGENITLKEVILLSLLICLGSLIRQSIAFSFIPFLFYLLICKKYKLFFSTLTLALISFTQIMNSLITGNPALPSGEVAVFAGLETSSLNAFERLKLSLGLLNMQNKFLNIGLFYSLLLFSSFVLVEGKKRLFLLSFLIMYWIIFHQISVLIWGIPRYLVEYTIPLSIVAIYHLMIKYGHSKTIYLFSFIIFGFNSFIITNRIDNLKVDSPFEYTREKIVGEDERRFKSEVLLTSEEVYNWEMALKKIPEKCYANSKMNVNFGVFPLAFNKKVTLSDFISSHTITGMKPDSYNNGICTYIWSTGNSGLSYNATWNTNIKLQIN